MNRRQSSSRKPSIQPSRIPLDLQTIYLASSRGEEIDKAPCAETTLLCRPWPTQSKLPKQTGLLEKEQQPDRRLCFEMTRETVFKNNDVSDTVVNYEESEMGLCPDNGRVALRRRSDSFRWRSYADDKPLQPRRSYCEQYMTDDINESLHVPRAFCRAALSFSSSLSSRSNDSYQSGYSCQTSQSLRSAAAIISSLTSLTSSPIKSPRRSRWTETKLSDKPPHLPRVPLRLYD